MRRDGEDIDIISLFAITLVRLEIADDEYELGRSLYDYWSSPGWTLWD